MSLPKTYTQHHLLVTELSPKFNDVEIEEDDFNSGNGLAEVSQSEIVLVPVTTSIDLHGQTSS